MPDILDEIIEILPPSTLELIAHHDFDHSEVGEDFSHILDDIENLHLSQVLNELREINVKMKDVVNDNSNLLSKLLSDLKLNECIDDNNSYERNAEALKKKFMDYEAQIKEMERKLEYTDCVNLFKNTENLYAEILELKSSIAKVKKTYECFEDIPPSIDGALKSIQDIKKRIKFNEEKAEELYFV